MPELNNNIISDSLKITRELQNFKEKYGDKSFMTMLNGINSFFDLNSVFPKEELTSENIEEKIPEEVEEINTPVEEKKIEEEKPLVEPIVDFSIYSQDPQILSKVQEDKETHIPEDITNLVEEKIEEEPPIFPLKDSLNENPVVEDLAISNPWSSAGPPVAPGQIEF